MSKTKMIYSYKTTQSTGHMYGMMTSVIIDYIQKAFEEDFFKTTRVTTDAPFIDRQKWCADVIIRKPRPTLLINPVFNPSAESAIRSNQEYQQFIPADTNSDMFGFGMFKLPLMKDKEGRFTMYTSTRRRRINMSARFIFDSNNLRLDGQELIMDGIRHNIPAGITRFIENNIPKKYIQNIADVTGLKLGSKELLDYLNVISVQPITYKYRPGNGNMEYFALQEVPMIIYFDGFPSPDQVTKKGIRVDYSAFEESIEVDFSANTMYYLETEKEIPKDDTSSASKEKRHIAVSIPLGEVPVFPEYENDFRRIMEFAVQLEVDEKPFSIESFIDGDVEAVRKYHVKNNIPINFLKLRIAKGGDRIQDFTFDPKTAIIDVKNVDQHLTYTLVLYCDYKYVNNFRSSLDASQRKNED